MKVICLTFDYELFFGKSGTFKNSIFRPTDDLVKTLDTFGIKATFFIDILYYQRLISVNKDEAKQLREQIQNLVARGHRIELHLHPHWLDAKYENPYWIFPSYDHYRLQSLPDEEVSELIVSGCEMLNEIAGEVVNNYNVRAFRAGGWCISPFEKIKQGFLKSGIIIDSSVAYGVKIESSPFNVDFTKVPDIEWYKFTDDPIIRESNGIFFEIPIATFHRNIYNKMLNRILSYLYFYQRKLSEEIYGDGSSIMMERKKGFKNLINKVKSNYGFLSIEQISPLMLLTNIEKSDKDLSVIMSHPKNISPSSLDCIKVLHDRNHKFVTLIDLVSQNILAKS
jgi:peptidoglycan/xylan/chitin deacetylase (PgdA/CDA1 family)